MRWWPGRPRRITSVVNCIDCMDRFEFKRKATRFSGHLHLLNGKNVECGWCEEHWEKNEKHQRDLPDGRVAVHNRRLQGCKFWSGCYGVFDDGIDLQTYWLWW